MKEFEKQWLKEVACGFDHGGLDMKRVQECCADIPGHKYTYSDARVRYLGIDFFKYDERWERVWWWFYNQGARPSHYSRTTKDTRFLFDGRPSPLVTLVKEFAPGQCVKLSGRAFSFFY